MYSWIYLCLVDRCAIRCGTWSINRKFSLPRYDWMPLEEIYFFLVTCTMCIWGLQLGMNVLTLDCQGGLKEKVRRVRQWARKQYPEESFEWTADSMHLASFVAFSAFALLTSRDLSVKSQVGFLFASTLVIGLPFGKVGQVLANWSQINEFRGGRFYFWHMSLALGVVAAWMFCPLIAFGVCTTSSVIHFGQSDMQGRRGAIPVIDFVARGGMLLFGAMMQPEGASWILLQLLSQPSVVVFNGLVILGRVHSLCLALSIAGHAIKLHKRHHRELLIEQVVLTAVFVLLPPLVSFMVYFNVLYTPRFLLRASRIPSVQNLFSKEFGQGSGKILGVTMGMVVFVALAFFHSTVNDAEQVGAEHTKIGSFLKLVFVLLSAVSTPHMVISSINMRKSDSILRQPTLEKALATTL
jgi:Brp/Blh family beta-carotene 15,15'-monooxygenase